MTSRRIPRWTLLLFLTTLLSASVTGDLRASGSYNASLGGLALHIDPARYELGKGLFLGRTALEPLAAAERLPEETQRALLKKWQAAVPEKARPQVPLDQLAGRLSATHQANLRYYLETRFRLKLDDK